DELLWRATWLHKETRNPKYFIYIQTNVLSLGADESDNTFRWDNKHYVTSASFILLAYAKYLSSSKHVVSCGQMAVTPRRLRAIVKRQVDYILGYNPVNPKIPTTNSPH
ncbi:hypothetical protein KI387_036627, partial [Taxus chinensis]